MIIIYLNSTADTILQIMTWLSRNELSTKYTNYQFRSISITSIDDLSWFKLKLKYHSRKSKWEYVFKGLKWVNWDKQWFIPQN